MRRFIRKMPLLRPHGLEAFLLSMYSKRRYSNDRTRLLDVGCGNNSVERVKKYFPDCYYIGIDIGDYNLKSELKGAMEEYHIVNPEEFSEKILEYKESVDIVISNHNIEHCNEPEQVLKSMAQCLISGGGIFMAFPSEESVSFPNREGTLNFFDDKTHQHVPNWLKILSTLEKQGIYITFKRKRYRPFLDKMRGKMNEKKSRRSKKALAGTWAYWGFESIVWGIKK